MLISFFTPTHDPKHLLEVFDSLRKQSPDVPFEWIIVCNNDLEPCDIPEDIQNNVSRVRIHRSELKGIGALKSYACSLCAGDVFVELDHDDLLSSDTTLEIAKAYEKEPEGFYYSDFVELKSTGRCNTYGSHYGWESYRCVIDRRPLTACRSFAPTARSLAQVYYAPNHIRAWSRSAYTRSGGHDPKLFIGDDHDLLCRTYIADIPFVYIPKPLYIYQLHKQNSFVKYNAEIQTQQNANMNKYLHQLILSECRREKRPIIDIGRESRCESGWTSHDVLAKNDPDCLYYKENEIGCIRAFDALQRIPTRSITRLMNGIYRVLAPGGWLISATPSIDDGEGRPGRGAYQDPSHQSWWSSNNFDYFTDKKYADLLEGYSGRFQLVRRWTGYPSDWHRKNYIPYVSADLSTLKGQRQPGEKKL